MWVEVEDADLLLVDDGPDGLQRGPVVRLLVLAVLNEPTRENITLKLQSKITKLFRQVKIYLLKKRNINNNIPPPPECI